MNLKEIITSTKAYNFHSHTQFCDGRASMAKLVEEAVKEGYLHYGFTPHSPIPFKSPCNMEMEQVEEYFNEFNRLKNLYKDKINLYISMEIDYLGNQWGATNPYFKNLPLDYRLSSVHFIPTPAGDKMIDIDGRPESFIQKMHEYFNDDIHYVVDTFYDHTMQMIESGGFDVLGHFDKIGFNASHFQPGIEDEDWYIAHIDRVIEKLKSTNFIVEINTKAWEAPVNSTEEQIKSYIPRLFPSPCTIAKLLDADIPLMVNSDTHYPFRLNSGRQAAFDIIDRLKGK